MNTHFDQQCPLCDYKSRTEGRLKRHIRDFHSEVPPDSWAGSRVNHNQSNESGSISDGGQISDAGSQDATTNGTSDSTTAKPRKYKCKQCTFVATNKNDFWDHSKVSNRRIYCHLLLFIVILKTRRHF